MSKDQLKSDMDSMASAVGRMIAKQIKPKPKVKTWPKMEWLIPSRFRFIRHTQAIDVCLSSWPIDPLTVYEFTMTPPVIPQSEETP